MFKNMLFKNQQWLLLVFCFISKTACAQYVIKLDNSNTFRQNQSYLIDVAIPSKTKSLFIADPRGLVPTIAFQKFSDAWGQIIDSIVIERPANPNEVTKATVTNTFMKTYLLAQKRGRDYELDSMTESNYIKYNKKYLYTVKPSAYADSVLIYYSEDDASSACCSIKPDTNTFVKYIANFEKKHHVTIGKVFGVTYGDEGEYKAYLTLSGLTQQQKINFIDGRKLSTSPGNVAPAVYRPVWVSSSYFIHLQKQLSEPFPDDPNRIYNVVENPPYYPKGQKAFKDYIYRKMNLPASFNARIIISFTVNKDGTLVDAKVERAADDKLNEKIVYVVSHSPKWKPGINDRKVVRVKYTLALYNPR
jgi:hypothetical protein